MGRRKKMRPGDLERSARIADAVIVAGGGKSQAELLRESSLRDLSRRLHEARRKRLQAEQALRSLPRRHRLAK
jgi:uncharacterized protein YigA (DUF484 family)